MKKLSVKILSLCLTLMLLLGVSGIAAFAAPASTMNITLRVEGISKNLFYKTEQVPYTDALTLQAALKAIDEQESGLTLTFTSISGGDYISGVNGETEKHFGGYDGWNYSVNGTVPSVGISDYKLKDGDSVVLYYGVYTIQCPTADLSKLANGIIKFTSSDTDYDTMGNPVVTVNPVTDAKVTWSYGSTSAVYTTDKNGSIKIDPAQLTAGKHGIQIAKASDAGLPLVLRFAPDYTVTVAQSSTTAAAAAATTAAATTTPASTASTSKAGNPRTGDTGSSAAVVFVLSLTAAAAALTIVKGRKSSYEK